MAQKQKSVLLDRKFKFQYHPITRVLAFLFAFSVVGAAFLYGAKATGNGPQITSADVSWELYKDKDVNRVISYGDSVVVQATNIKYDKKEIADRYETFVELNCFDRNNEFLATPEKITPTEYTGKVANVDAEFVLSKTNNGEWDYPSSAKCFAYLRLIDRGASWSSWWPSKPDNKTLPNSSFNFDVRGR